MRSTPSAIRAAAERIAKHTLREDEVAVCYRLDLALEAFLNLSAITGDPAWQNHVASVAKRRGWQSDTNIFWRTEPFASLSWALASDRRDKIALAVFVEQTRLMQNTIWRSDDNLVLHPRGETRGGGYAVLIDSGAEYFSRTAKAAQISGELDFAVECADQMTRHRNLLRNPANGLYSQGRGWLADRPTALSPGAWSRGQGWLMRGFASALNALPRNSQPYAVAQKIFQELADALLPLQDDTGLWHALPHRPRNESAIETSGSGLIAASLLLAVSARHLPKDPYLSAACRAAEELCRHVDDQGIVHDACPGPGPLQEEEPWLIPQFAPGDHHGPGTVLGCLAAALAV